MISEKTIPDTWNTDHNRLTQIILNLLSNALKFTFKGGITLSASLNREGNLVIEVSDTGIGIKKEDQDKLFRKFAKIDLGDKMNENSTGVGLGLTIANMLARMLGPKSTNGIKFKTEYGKGTSFRFEIDNKNETFHEYYQRKAEEADRIKKTRSFGDVMIDSVVK